MRALLIVLICRLLVIVIFKRTIPQLGFFGVVRLGSLALDLWLGSLAWDLGLGIFGLGSLVWGLRLGTSGLGSLAWDLWLCLGIFGLGSLSWDLWLGILGFGSLALDLRLGILRLGKLDPQTGGTSCWRVLVKPGWPTALPHL